MNADNSWHIKDDLLFLMESLKKTKDGLSDSLDVSRATLDSVLEKGTEGKDVLEKVYAFAYENNFRINLVKEELYKERYENVLFHGSKSGLNDISVEASRQNCDFGKGFYLGETYNQALSFVYDKKDSSVYTFRASFDGLKIKKFECDLDWMLAICHYRGTLGEYDDSEIIGRIVREVEDADVVVAPIADNKMFHVMTQFAVGDINADVALHSLSASRLGLQYVLRTEKALDMLVPLERLYISSPERNACRKGMEERGFEIETKLKLSKRTFRDGPYIEELLHERI